MRYPKPLQKGDKIAVLCPSTPTKPEKVNKAEQAMKDLGFEPVMFPSCYAYHGHLSGPDDLRAKDINDAFRDPEIKGIICLKGGSGSTRLLKKLDYDMIRENPKVFLGYSDITALLTVFNQICDFVTFHGPMASSDVFTDEDDRDYNDPYTVESFMTNITSEFKGVLNNPVGESFKTLVPGTCEGLLCGGNLSLLTNALGSPYEIDTKGKIIFLEEVSEPNYVVDKMLMSLVLAGKFDDCAGIILGTFSKCEPELKQSYGGHDLSLDTIFAEVLAPLGKPILANLRAGHNSPQPTLAMGVKVRLDATNQVIEFL